MPHNPRFDKAHFADAVALKTLNEIRTLAHQIPAQKGLKLSRSSARKLVEDLVIEGSVDKATERMLTDPIGTLSLLWLARRREDILDTGHYKPEDTPRQAPFPYQVFCLWLLDLGEKGALRWTDDEDEEP